MLAEALRTGFFEYQAIRDSYRELTMGNVHRELILKFIETQAIILSPICPHVSEHVWKLLGKTETILRAQWPSVPEFDRATINAGSYLNQAVQEFRLRMKTYLSLNSAKDAKRSTNLPVEKPTHGTIWIARCYPTWQTIILTALQEKFSVCIN